MQNYVSYFWLYVLIYFFADVCNIIWIKENDDYENMIWSE